MDPNLRLPPPPLQDALDEEFAAHHTCGRKLTTAIVDVAALSVEIVVGEEETHLACAEVYRLGAALDRLQREFDRHYEDAGQGAEALDKLRVELASASAQRDVALVRAEQLARLGRREA